MDALVRDVRFAVRVLLRRPLVTALAALSLALGIGANTTSFSIVNALFLKALPVAAGDRLVALYTTDRRNPDLAPISHLNWRDIGAQSDVFEAVAAYDWLPLSGSTAQPEGLLFS